MGHGAPSYPLKYSNLHAPVSDSTSAAIALALSVSSLLLSLKVGSTKGRRLAMTEWVVWGRDQIVLRLNVVSFPD